MRFGLVRRAVSLSVALCLAAAVIGVPAVAADGADPNVAPTVTATVSNANPVEAQTVVGSATFTDPESATETYTCTVYYGDGSFFVTGVVSGMTCTDPGVHHYQVTGSYVVMVVVTDSGGVGGLGMTSVSYTNVAPTLLDPALIGDPHSGHSVSAAIAISDPGSATETYDCLSVDYGDGTSLQPGTYVPTGWGDGLPRCVYPAHAYTVWGPYTITMTVGDGGNVVTTSTTQTIWPSKPIVSCPSSLVVQPANGRWHLDATASFVDASVPSPGPWPWTISWGDGTTSYGIATSPGDLPYAHDYFAPGTYSVDVTVQDADRAGDQVGSQTCTVIAYNSAPTVVAPTDMAVVTEGVQGTFYWAVVDPAPDYPYSVHVDWGDGSITDLTAQSLPSGVFALPHTYRASDPLPTPGGTIYTATMTVTDRIGASGSASQQVGVRNIAPVITAPASVSVPEGPVTTITLGSFADASVGPWIVYITDHSGLAIQQQFSAPGPIQMAYAFSMGNRTLTVLVADRGQLVSTTTVQVVSVNAPPIIGDAQFTPGSPVAGSHVTVAAPFSDPGLSVTPPETFTCNVDYGDGSGPQAGTVSGQRCLGSDHVYARSGQYSATIKVVDSHGGVGAATANLTVRSLPPVITVTVSDTRPIEPETVVASATLADPASSFDTYTCTIDYGDSAPVAGVMSGPTCVGPPHQYGLSATYLVTATVTNQDGVSGVATTSLVYSNIPPVVHGFGLVGDLRVGSITHAVTAMTDPGEGIESYACRVDYGDGSALQLGTWIPGGGSGGSQRCVFPDHVYSMAGAYTLTVAVGDSGGEIGSAQFIETITPYPPAVQIVSSQPGIEGQTPMAVSASFSQPGTSAGSYTCEVDFGDGMDVFAGTIAGNTCSAESAPEPAGTYNVTVSITDSYGGTGQATVSLNVANEAPVVWPYDVSSPVETGRTVAGTVMFIDPDVQSVWPRETFSCTVDYGDGTGPQPGQLTDDYLKSCVGPDHAYAMKGTYTFVASVTDSNGATGTYTTQILVYGPSPIVGPVSAPTTAKPGTAVTAFATYSPTGQDPADTCTVDYGDGTGAVAGLADGTTCQGPSHIYAATGTFTITVTVLAANGSTASSSATIKVYSLLVGAISESGTPTEGSPVAASAGFTPTGSQSYKCKVDYGDGSGAQNGMVSGSTCRGPSHKYGRPGSFQITVTVTGSRGNTGTSTTTLDIANVTPTVTATLPGTAKIGSSVTLTASFTDPGTTETYQAFVDWGDGVRTPILLGCGRSFSATHTYKATGNYSVVVGVSDDQAHTSTASLVISIFDPARTLSGSGTFASPAGACTLSSKCAAASTATFAVSATYPKGATKPTATFTFSATGVSFTATSADWYLVTDGVGTLSGSGKLNGVSGYKFSVFAVDGSPDKILVNIVGPDGFSVYFNNDYSSLKTGSIAIK